MLFTALLGLAAVASAAPFGTADDYARVVDTRAASDSGLSSSEYEDIKFYAQHAAAAYCNFDTPNGDPIVCRGKNTCAAVQENKPTVVGSTIGSLSGVGAYVAVDTTRSEIVVAFRGSNNVRNYVTDVLFLPVPCDDLVSDCLLHVGFVDGWNEVKDDVTAALKSAVAKNPGHRVVVAGHSLGGAVATIASAYLRKQGYTLDVFTYGSPRVGNAEFVNFFAQQPGIQRRVTHEDDPVPQVPPMHSLLVEYRHVSPEYWLTGGSSTQTEYPLSSVKVCSGIDNVNCNGGTGGLNLPAHLYYLGETSGCSGIPILLKRDEAALSDVAFHKRLDEWHRRDMELAAKRPH